MGRATPARAGTSLPEPIRARSTPARAGGARGVPPPAAPAHGIAPSRHVASPRRPVEPRVRRATGPASDPEQIPNPSAPAG